MHCIPQSQAEKADRKAEEAVTACGGKSLSPETLFLLHRATWAAHAGGDVVRVVPDKSAPVEPAGG